MPESVSTTDRVRLLIQNIDNEKRIIAWCDVVRGSMNLGRPMRFGELLQRGPFGKKREYHYVLEDRMPREAVEAMYRAINKVSEEATAKIKYLEDQIEDRHVNVRE